ncbi:MAG: GNAT family N-acetyltransferase [Phormidesmis sp.]
MDVCFQLAQLADINILMRYMREFHEFDHNGPFDETPAQAAMEKVVADKAVGRVWLIQEGEETIGYMVLTLSYRLEYRGYYAFLDELYIREDMRSQGIGSAAIAFLEQSCQDLNAVVLQLEVKSNNPAAAALYEKLGFECQDREVFLKPIPQFAT